MIHRSFRYRLYPTAEQAEKLTQFVGAVRFVYNLCLEQRRNFWRQYQATTGDRLNFVSQGRQVTALRHEVDWIAAAPSNAFARALRDLDSAYAAFFAGRAKYPTPRRKGANDSFRVSAASAPVQIINGKWAVVRLPKVGAVKLRLTRAIRGRVQSATISRNPLGWHVSFACEIAHEATPTALPSVGIDRGIANTIALSTGEFLSTSATVRLERRKKRAQRVLARRERGSNRYRKQRERVGRISAKIARVRVDWRHRTTADLAQRFGAVALEDLKTANLVRSPWRGLNRAILEQGWRNFETVLAYKLEERGGTLIKVNPAYTSQECSACGTIDKASRESQASFACRHCGFAAHADTNAAINILRRSTAAMRVEGSGYAPVEARTAHALAA